MINPLEFMKNASQMKEQMNKLKEELAEMTVTGNAGGNMVQVTLNGQFEMKAIKLDPICVDNRDIPMLQDLIVAAHHDAIEKVQQAIAQKTSSLLGGFGGLDGLNIPGL